MKLARIFLWALLMAAFYAPDSYAQFAEVKNIPENDIWDLVEFTLREKGLTCTVVDQKENCRVSSPMEYTSSHAVYRVRFSFQYEKGLLKIVLTNFQFKTGKGWSEPSAPKKKNGKQPLEEMVANLQAAQVALNTKRASGQARLMNQVSLNKSDSGSSYQALPEVTSARKLLFDANSHYFFSEGLCALQRGQRWGFIDTLGNVVIDFKYRNKDLKVPCFQNGVCTLWLFDDSIGASRICIDKTGQQLFESERFTGLTSFSNALAIAEKADVKNNRLLCFIGLSGKPLHGAITPGYSKDMQLDFRGFSEGLAPLYDWNKKGWGFIDTLAKWVVVPDGKYESVTAFHEGLSFFCENIGHKWGAFNPKGELVIPFMYSNQPGDLSDGLAAVKNDEGKVGYMDPTGSLVIPCIYEPIRDGKGLPFVDGYTIVLREGCFYFLTSAGQEVRKVGKTTAAIRMFDNGLIAFKEWTKNNQWAWGLMRTNGELFFAPNVFLSIGEWNNGLAYAKAQMNNQTYNGFINQNGDFVVLQLCANP